MQMTVPDGSCDTRRMSSSVPTYKIAETFRRALNHNLKVGGNTENRLSFFPT